MEKRLIEADFPLKQASLDSLHEKNVRHGHISTLHIWPARRPLAASRAAIIATLLPDPPSPIERRSMVEKIGGLLKEAHKTKKLPNGRIEAKVTQETEGGVLHWGRESNSNIEWIREKIKETYGGHAPKVLDPFSGGGAIPLEAMRMGCDATAIDINPVAWFVLKCTLKYPQRLAGQQRVLPKFALDSADFMESYFKIAGKKSKNRAEPHGRGVQSRMFDVPAVSLSWHVRAWAWWVLERAKTDLERLYSGVAGQPSVAYLWARTVKCKNCRGSIPLLKTRWLCKKDNKRVLLTMQVDDEKTGVVFDIERNVPQVGGNATQRREHDKRISAGTMSRSGATCPCCGTIMIKEDIQREGLSDRLGTVMTAVVVDGNSGKDYRVPTQDEIDLAIEAEQLVPDVFERVPFGLPRESLTLDAKGNTWCMLYGVDSFHKLFTSRQLVAVGTFVNHTRAVRDAMLSEGYPPDWIEAVESYLALILDRLISFNCANVRWKVDAEAVVDAFARFALPILWDYAEAIPVGSYAGSYQLCYERIAVALDGLLTIRSPQPPTIIRQSATSEIVPGTFDAVVTDPPYYDSIGYSVIMDFFHVWLRRTLHGLSPEIDAAFASPLAPKWDSQNNDGELIDDASRFGGDKVRSKAAYEDGMFQVFKQCHKGLKPEGRLVVVFANKQPDAWETLVSAIIRAGFVVNGSWPIQTEMGNRTRALSSAALSSSVWLICKKRSPVARPGWDNRVLEEMKVNIATRLRDFWDAGIRGPDFVWAATGPAMEAYSKHPVVKKADAANNEVMTVSEFLRQVRRIVVNFVVGRVLSTDGDERDASELDSVTTYYLLHRHDFGMEDAPIGACILYAVSCNLSDKSLADHYDILQRTGGKAAQNDDDDVAPDDAETPADDDEEEGTGSVVKLKTWQQRNRKGMGYDTESRSSPLIDQVHRLMHLWKAGDVNKVNDYIDARGLRRNALFIHLLQALIESAAAGSEERALLESISNHMAARGIAPVAQPTLFGTK